MKHKQSKDSKESNKRKEDVHAYASLCRRSDVPCDLCNVVSRSRYSSYIHNMKHMIIPLVNLTIYKCQECVYICSSQEELKKHKILHNLNAKVVIPKLELPTPLTPQICSIKHSVPLQKRIIFESPEKEKSLPLFPAKSIKSRLMFEEDVPNLDFTRDTELSSVDLTCSSIARILKDTIDSQNKILEDLTVDCQVQMEMLPFKTKSIHYEELIKPGLFKCKICYRSFPTRFDMISHESSHIYIKNSQITLCTVCNLYIKGNERNMQRHILFAHRPSMEDDLVIVPDNVTSLNNKILPLQPQPKKIRFEFEDDKISDSKESYLNLCDVCMAFCLNYNNINIRYTFVQCMRELNKQFNCDECGGRFFDINIVKRMTKLRKQFNKARKKGVSNEERLKSIKQRFKLMKKKYFCVLF